MAFVRTRARAHSGHLCSFSRSKSTLPQWAFVPISQGKGQSYASQARRCGALRCSVPGCSRLGAGDGFASGSKEAGFTSTGAVLCEVRVAVLHGDWIHQNSMAFRLSMLSFAGASQVPQPPESCAGPLAGLPLSRAPASPAKPRNPRIHKNSVQYLGCLVPTCCKCNILELPSSCFLPESVLGLWLETCFFLNESISISFFIWHLYSGWPPTTIHNLLLSFTAVVTTHHHQLKLQPLNCKAWRTFQSCLKKARWDGPAWTTGCRMPVG